MVMQPPGPKGFPFSDLFSPRKHNIYLHTCGKCYLEFLSKDGELLSDIKENDGRMIAASGSPVPVFCPSCGEKLVKRKAPIRY